MNIIYLSTALSDEVYNEVVSKCKRFKPTFSGVGFDRNVAVGLSEMASISGVSLYPIPSYPKFNRFVQPSRAFSQGSFSCKAPWMLSLPVIKEYCYAINAYRYIKQQRKQDDSLVILVSGLYRSLLRPALLIKKRYGVPIIAVVPDLPEQMILYRKDYSRLRTILNKVDLFFSRKYRRWVDGFVELSVFMNPYANEKNKPFVIMDGLCNLELLDEVEAKPAVEGKYIMYAGKVSSTFGTDKLVSAFLASKLTDYSLVICGDGDFAPELRKITESNPQIVFVGAVPHNTVVAMEKAATLLVEPRPSDTVIAKMYFPSKIIEYMASGTPVLVTNIPSFEDSYCQYQYRIEEESIEGIAKALTETLSLPEEALRQKGEAAKVFVLNNKTISKQCEKVINLIRSVTK